MEKVPVEGSGPSLVARRGEPRLLLYGHVDTVAPSYGWSQDPFRLKVEGDRAIGLGACDMKGGLVAILKAVEETDLPAAVAFSSDEELYSRGCYALVRGGYLRGLKYAISAEPSCLALKIGRRGRYVFSISIRSRSEHASSSPLSPSLRCLSRFIDRFQDLVRDSPRDPFLGGESVSILKVEAGTPFLSTPDTCTVILDWHCVSKGFEGRKERVARFLSDICPGCSYEVRLVDRPTPFMEPYRLPEDDPFVQLVARAFEEVLGKPPRIVAGLSVADENFLANLGGIKVVTLGPIGGNGHSADEWVDIKSIETVSEVYKRLLELVEGR